MNSETAVVVCRSAPNAVSARHWYVGRSPYESRRLAVLALLTPSNDRIERVYVAKDVMRVDFTLWHRQLAAITAVPLNKPSSFTRG
jgi:hypothetical protein